MKKHYFSLFLLIAPSFLLIAQSLTEDFESYQVNEFIGSQSDDFFTWTAGNEGTGQDVLVVSDNASSGNNSIYFKSTSATGGPQDLVLDLGGNHNTGFLNYSHKMFVTQGADAYFNFQGIKPVGQEWIFEVRFTNGVVSLSSGGVVSVQGNYPEGKWFEVSINANMDAELWDMSIDGLCIGSFLPSGNRLAAVNYYPVPEDNTTAEYWIDDIQYKYEENAQEISLDLGININSIENYYLEGKQITYLGRAFNSGVDDINSFEVEVSYNGSSQAISSNETLAPGEGMDLILSSPIEILADMNTMEVVANKINGQDTDDYQCNNGGVIQITGVVPAKNKGVLVEEGTGTWCGWCPRGAVFMDRHAEKYEEHFVGIAVHNGDVMTVTEYDDAIGFTGFPDGKINRDQNMDPSVMDASIASSVQVNPRGVFNIGADYDDGTKEMKISVEVQAIKELDAKDKIFVAIVEDNVVGDNSQYNQSNYYSGGGSGVMGGYENLGNPVPYTQMVYQDVARAMITPFDGSDKVVGPLAEGESKVYNFYYTLPEEYVKENIRIVAVLLNYQKRADNAKETTFEEAIANGFIYNSNEEDSFAEKLELSPNPSSDLLNIYLETSQAQNVSLHILNAYGEVVLTDQISSSLSKQNWLVDISNLKNGMYVASFVSGNKLVTKKFLKIKR